MENSQNLSKILLRIQRHIYLFCFRLFIFFIELCAWGKLYSGTPGILGYIMLYLLLSLVISGHCGVSWDISNFLHIYLARQCKLLMGQLIWASYREACAPKHIFLLYYQSYPQNWSPSFVFLAIMTFLHTIIQG